MASFPDALAALVLPGFSDPPIAMDRAPDAVAADPTAMEPSPEALLLLPMASADCPVALATDPKALEKAPVAALFAPTAVELPKYVVPPIVVDGDEALALYPKAVPPLEAVALSPTAVELVFVAVAPGPVATSFVVVLDCVPVDPVDPKKLLLNPLPPVTAQAITGVAIGSKKLIASSMGLRGFNF